jgi:hypothetical protein
MLALLMDFTRRIRVPVLLLAVLVALCAADIAGPAMVMAGGQSCLGPACEDQIACGQPTQPQISSGSSTQPVVLPVSAERLFGLVKTETRTVDPPPARVVRQSLAPLGSRSPPAV